MTDRPFAGGAETAVGPTPGYYPDPSVPGFVRYWGGTAWVPGTSRPAPAAGEVLQPPRFAARRGGVAGGAGAGVGAGPGAGARFVPPPASPEAHPPSSAVPSSAAPSSIAPSSVAPARAVPSPAVPAIAGVSGETGPVYLDQTAGGASFSVGPHLAARAALRPAVAQPAAGGEAARVGVIRDGAAGQERGGPVAEAEEVEEQRAGEPGAVGWQVDPRAQRGLMETGGAPRWVSWGVLPGAEPDSGADGPAEDRAVGAARLSGEASGERAEHVAAPVAGRAPEAVPVPASVPAPASEPEPESESQPVSGQASGSQPDASGASAVAVVPAGTVPRTLTTSSAPTASSVAAPAPVARPVGAPAPGALADPAKAGAAAPRPARRRPPAPLPAGLGRRLAARLVDTAVLAVVATATAIPLGNSVVSHVQQKLDQARMASALTRRQVDVWLVDGVVLGKVAVLFAVLAFVGVLYEVLPTARTGQTFGKRLVRIRVVDAAPSAARDRLSLARSLARWLARNASAVLLLGLVWPLFDRPARRGWHDRMAGTRVVRG
ncbi:RDD family protein [Kitasatospora sp. NPDC005748]|uniref:RDD family protein n=1 Tax=Kitasatospora sp. NPDC005748 TaxID=3157063 RepID=UPI0033E2693D